MSKFVYRLLVQNNKSWQISILKPRFCQMKLNVNNNSYIFLYNDVRIFSLFWLEKFYCKVNIFLESSYSSLSIVLQCTCCELRIFITEAKNHWQMSNKNIYNDCNKIGLLLIMWSIKSMLSRLNQKALSLSFQPITKCLNGKIFASCACTLLHRHGAHICWCL
jgi:hypothetical protein